MLFCSRGKPTEGENKAGTEAHGLQSAELGVVLCAGTRAFQSCRALELKRQDLNKEKKRLLALIVALGHVYGHGPVLSSDPVGMVCVIDR